MTLQEAAGNPTLVVWGQCQGCSTWVLVASHSEDECSSWLALRANPSHEHEWEWVGTAVVACRECRTLGEVVS